MDDFKSIIGKVATGATLSRDEAASAFDSMMSGEATPSQMGGLLMALRVRGETVDEITGAVSAMRAKMLRVEAPADAVDVVGTGGDGSGSVNVSTCASFIVAGTGVPVAKHGNRALSSRSGAADVLSSLGVKIDITPEQVGHCVAKAGIGFMFAPTHHPATKNVGPTRTELGTRTIFNLLGPLSNPAGVRRQMVGVFSRQWVLPLAQVLKNLGAESAWVVHGSDGLDEITLTGPTHVAALENGNIRTFDVTPEEAGLARVGGDALKGGDANANAEQILFDQSARIDQQLAGINRNVSPSPQAFFLGFAGVGEQRVFAEEIALASKVLSDRYGMNGRGLSLVNDERDLESGPLASLSALRYALAGLSEKMLIDRDVLFLAISSHGSKDPAIAVSNSQLPLNDISDEDLAQALQDSGIKWRVIIISACYAGAFINAVKNPQTIVITAAASDRTSFGCSNDRDLTYFGEAFYRDALPDANSLRDAFEKAKVAIVARERREHVDASRPEAYFGAELESKLGSMRAVPQRPQP